MPSVLVLIKMPMVWNVYIIKGMQFIKIGEHEFDYYDTKSCMKDIMANRPDLAKRIREPFRKGCDYLGQSWTVTLKSWD